MKDLNLIRNLMMFNKAKAIPDLNSCVKLSMWLAVIIFMACLQPVFALTDSELIAVRDGFESRRTSMLYEQVQSPYPPSTSPEADGIGIYMWNRFDYALSAFYQNIELDEANQAILDACEAANNYSGLSHWYGNLCTRIYELFSQNSEFFPGRLSVEAEEAMCDLMWQWAKVQSVLSHADYSQNQTWIYWGSENHDMMHKSTSYGIAAILRNVPAYQNLLYDDGSTASQQYTAWNAYFKEYLKQRAQKGLFVEIASHTYAKYTLQGVYNIYDFAPDEELRELAKNTLDMWWTDWALDQIDSVRGGGKTRVYQYLSLTAFDDSAYGMAWYYLNVGYDQSRHPGIMCMLTSRYRLPLVVMDLALDTTGKGVYEYSSRRVGLKSSLTPGYDLGEGAVLDAETPGILRYTYHTPAYVLGTLMVEKRSNSEWAPISSQNRLVGAIFSSHKDARISPQCERLNDGNKYNELWSVQHKGTLIVQKLVAESVNAGDMMVYFSGDATNMTISENSGWIFAEMPNAYAAVRPAWGSYSWDEKWIRLSDSTAPVIMEVWQSSDFNNSFNEFKTAVQSQIIDVDAGGVLTYTGLKDAGTLTFYTQTSDLPRINGTPINLATSYAYQSPFVNSDWGSGLITISKDDRLMQLNFEADTGSGSLNGDLNQDGYVDIDDLAILAAEWGADTN